MRTLARWLVPFIALGAVMAGVPAPRVMASVDDCPPYPCLETAQAVMDLDLSSVTPEQVATVPLAERATTPRPRMLVGFDVGPWAYWDQGDLHPQGSSATGNTYNFSRWQYADTIYYYDHALLAIPPTTWTNAAHRNGVTVLGTITGDCDGCADERVALAQTAGAADKLEAIAEAYGFDGWLWDVESGPGGPGEVTQAEIDLMADLRSRTLPDGRPFDVAFYQAGTYELDATNDPDEYAAFLAAGTFQADYDPAGQVDHPKQTFQTLKDQGIPGRRYDTYWASDAYYCELGEYYKCGGPNEPCTQTTAEGLFNGTKCLSLERLLLNMHSIDVAGEGPPGTYQSLSIYAPNWTMFGGLSGTSDPLPSRATFQAADDSLWLGTGAVGSGGYELVRKRCRLRNDDVNAIAPMVEPRTVITQLPFVSRFNMGEGDAFAVRGTAGAGRMWNHLAPQDVLPTSLCTQSKALRASVGYADAFDGGSELVITGKTAPRGRRISLFETEVDLPATSQIELTYRANGASAIPRAVAWIDGKGRSLTPGPTATLPGGWTRVTSHLPGAGGSLTRLGLSFGTKRTKEPVDVEIGEFALVDPSVSDAPPAVAATLQGSLLTWAEPSEPATWYADVWAVTGADCLVYMGRSFTDGYETSAPMFAPAPPPADYEVQLVSTAGRAGPLSHAVC